MKTGGGVGAVLVVGGGIGGLQASLDLADSGFKVYLLDRSPSIGGSKAQLDKTFPTNDCAMCILAPKLVEIANHQNISLLTYADLMEVKGESGNFQVHIRRNPRYVDEEKCTGCGSCSARCPVKIPDEYNAGLKTTTCIHIPFPQAVPNIALIDKNSCIYLDRGRCGICKKVCEPGAVDFEQEAQEIEVNVGSIILATGFSTVDANNISEYGYARYPNVITSVEFERLVCVSGPTYGNLQRPSDGKVPKSVAFLQCVGSRDRKRGNDYCSSICCMYSTKHAIMAHEHYPEIKYQVFFMDLRNFGKGSEEYYRMAVDRGIKYTRCRISGIEQTPGFDLKIRYEDENGLLKEEEFGLVVLAMGLKPPKDTEDFAKILGIELNEFGFCATETFRPLQTSREGVYVCGVFSGPKDIPDTVAQGSAAAAVSSRAIISQRGKLVREKEYPEELRIGLDAPARIGVFVCHCGTNIAGVIDVQSVSEYAKKLKNVVYSEDTLYTCSQETATRMKEIVEVYGLNRIVVAACSPRTHEPLFQDTIGQVGLNPYLFEMANIRDQCSWVHARQPEEATQKAKDLVRMAVARARMLRPLKRIPQGVKKSVLVIGGGVSGMTAALEVAQAGYDVHLVERERELGGQFRRVRYLLSGEDPQGFLREMVRRVDADERISVYKGAEVSSISGYVGNFTAEVRQNGRSQRIEAGAIVVATGGRKYEPVEYMYGKDERIIRQLDLEEMVAEDRLRAKDIVMIQCVGSREEDRIYCSRVCCTEAIKNALKIKEKYPWTNIYILYRDLRTYGFNEIYYIKAREQGVIFIRYDENDKPKVSISDGRLEVQAMDLILGEELVFNPDLLVLNAAIVPNESEELSQMLKVPLTKDGFFLEAHVKLRPIDFATSGVFLCGLAHSPKFIDESISQASGVAGRISTILSKDYVESEGIVSAVDEDRCRECGTCVDICSFGAIEMITNEAGARVARINSVLCKGCGACAVACPSSAITPRHYTDEQIGTIVEAMMVEEFGVRV